VQVSYESLLAEPEAELERLQHACGLAPDPDVTEYARHVLYDNPPATWPQLDPTVDLLFRQTMDLLGYADGRDEGGVR